jgi:diguanylate cyclase (GGDEF)-like protein
MKSENITFSSSFGGRRPRVLIVDDAAETLRFLGEELKDECEVILATTAEKALSRVQSSQVPDLILLDIMLPDIDGYQVCSHLKADATTRNIPVIFISARNEEDDEAQGFSCGGVDYITKPFRMPIVKARIKTHLELKRRGDILESLSSIDGLTSVPNRRRYDEVLAMEWRRGQRNNTQLSMIFLDIDHFKLYNDTYGHLLGDDCLKLVAHTLASELRRPGDFLARFGGEEFVVVLPDTDLPGVEFLAEAMRKAVMELAVPNEQSPTAPCVTVSLGTATMLPASGSSPSVLVEAADKMLYLAKKEGRNQVRSISL